MIVKNGQVALSGRERPELLDIRIRDGRIVEVAPDLSGDESLIDADGLLVLPGAIDPHVHFDDPGYTDREDFFQGSCAAASGGITTVVDMPCTSIPPVTNHRNLVQKRDVVEKKSVVDFGLYGGVSAQSLAAGGLQAMAELAPDVLGFKAYFVSGMDTFDRLDHYQFRRVLERARDLDRPLLLHAEDYDYVTAATPVAASQGNLPLHYYYSRPETAEMLAVLAAVQLANEVGGDLHVVHVGTAAAAEHIAEHGATCETGPHYLAFTLEDFTRIGAPLKVTPPIKSPENRERLWQLLAGGQISFVASDHAPCSRAEKSSGSIWTDYGGIPGTGTVFPYLFSEGYASGRIGLARLLQVVSEAAAKRYGLWDRKGSIAPGKDADLVLVDPESEWTIRGETFYSKGKVTPFEGLTLRGRVVKTILRGQVIFSADEGISVDGGYGEMLRAHK